MYRLTHRRILSCLLGFPLACGSSSGGGTESAGPGAANGFITDGDGRLPSAGSGEQTTPKAAPFVFGGAGTSLAALPLSAGLGPETSGECNPEPVTGSSATIDEVQTVCFYGEDEPEVPAAAIEQVVEVIGTAEWVHVRLTLNPDFVDNTYGANAIGWGDADGAPPAAPPAPGAPPPVVADAGAPPPPPAPPAAAPPARGERGGPHGAGGRAASGHRFRDLVGSDHAEMQLLDADGNIAVQFKLDYLSASEAASSGFESLGVSGGEGKLIAGDEAAILASTTSLDRNLEACELAAFLEDSPATDAAYSANPDAPEWDFRVSYEVWIAADAFGSAGFGSASIELVHASPSKLAGDSVDVRPAPCPADPENPELPPQPLPPVLSNPR